MKLLLSQIKPSPKPIRSSWDETKMDELKWSLMEEGQVEPIGVHENGQGHYVIVWGHRRVEAARRAGWNDIEAVVVPQDEVDNLIQAGIENLAGEDMIIKDKADWVYILKYEYGLSLAEISRRSTVEETKLGQWLIWKREKEAGVQTGLDSFRADDEGVKKVINVARVLGDDTEAKNSILEKASNENLNRDLTKLVAEAYRDAPTPEVKKKVLETPIMSRDTAADILRRSVNRVELDTGVKIQQESNDWQKEREERREMQQWDFAVKEFLDSMKLFEQIADKGSALVKYGKFTPEAARFTIRRIDRLINSLKNYREALELVE